ncbi:hypothetical protein CDAR_14981 [Caerostris darwini]|uniref:Uncharacterized protein n=1 Tax=Caerostris darwini TaxID=1538125 RepID=A0AAV4PCK2_9ARAC|nr:hypothetical protein CDAR_14981 [Caerostris darwini]
MFSNSTDHHTKLPATPEAPKESCCALLELEASGMMQLVPVEERNFTFKRSRRSHSLPKNGTKKTAYLNAFFFHGLLFQCGNDFYFKGEEWGAGALLFGANIFYFPLSLQTVLR